MDNGVRVPCGWRWRVHWADAAAQQLDPPSAMGIDVREHALPGPGGYRVWFDDLPGFRPIPARTVEITRVGRTKLAIELERVK
jgi:hypothetical protein